jgi:hypothetical protein
LVIFLIDNRQWTFSGLGRRAWPLIGRPSDFGVGLEALQRAITLNTSCNEQDATLTFFFGGSALPANCYGTAAIFLMRPTPQSSDKAEGGARRIPNASASLPRAAERVLRGSRCLAMGPHWPHKKASSTRPSGTTANTFCWLFAQRGEWVDSCPALRPFQGRVGPASPCRTTDSIGSSIEETRGAGAPPGRLPESGLARHPLAVPSAIDEAGTLGHVFKAGAVMEHIVAHQPHARLQADAEDERRGAAQE